MAKKFGVLSTGILISAAIMLLSVAAAVNAQSKRNDPDQVKTELIAKERQKWDALMAGKWGDLKHMFADDYLSIGYRPDGSVRMDTKADTFAPQGKLPPGIVFALSDFKVVFANKDSAVVTYIADGPIKVHATSVWAKRGIDWKTVFYQATMTK